MEFDVVLLLILIVTGILFFRTFKGSIYFIACLDIFFRILTFIKIYLNINEVSEFINKYFPESIPSIIRKYTSDVVTDILLWIYIIVFAIFLGYTVKILWKKR